MNHVSRIATLGCFLGGCAASSVVGSDRMGADAASTVSGAAGNQPGAGNGGQDDRAGSGGGDVGSGGAGLGSTSASAGGSSNSGGAGGESVSGSAGSRPGAGGTASGGGSASGGAPIADGGPPDGQTFLCSEMVGLWVMSQWWGTFEKGVDNARWEYIFVHHGYLETWADPKSSYWTTAVISPCAMNAGGPDRVVFLPFSLTLNTLEQWQANLLQVVEAIKTNFHDVKRIELISTIRSPGNQPCPNDADPNVVVPAYVDQAIQNVADGSGGLVIVGPKIAVANCNWWAGGTDLTGAGNTGVGQLYADYYKNH